MPTCSYYYHDCRPHLHRNCNQTSSHQIGIHDKRQLGTISSICIRLNFRESIRSRAVSERCGGHLCNWISTHKRESSLTIRHKTKWIRYSCQQVTRLHFDGQSQWSRWSKFVITMTRPKNFADRPPKQNRRPNHGHYQRFNVNAIVLILSTLISFLPLGSPLSL